MKLDFHSHILPGLDDGATDISNAIELASAMKSWGFEKVTCTPHITNKFRNTPDTIRPVFEQLQEALYVNGVDLELHMSAEYRLVPETWPEVLERKWIMPIEDKFLLMELPIFNPYDIGDIKPIEEFRKVVSMGLTPILPHPERYSYLSRQELMSYLEAGVKLQSNYGSVAGLYGTDVQQTVYSLIEEGLISYYGTDMHNLHYADVIGKWFAEGGRIADYLPDQNMDSSV